MPPRIAPSRGRGTVRSARGGAPRGGTVGTARGGHQIGLPTSGAHITTVGVKRSNFGTGGKPISIYVNSFATTIPEGRIYHYDVILPSEKTLPRRLNMKLIEELQNVETEIFTSRAVYDGRKNLYAVHVLRLGDTDSCEFDVPFSETGTATGGRGPKVYKIRLTKVAEINPEVLTRFVDGDQSHDNTVLTAITALNVVIRMSPTVNPKYTSNTQSFFTNEETKDIGSGLELWRGYFQSVRPGIGRMLINIDISTGVMYKDGNLLDICLQHLGKSHPNALAPRRGLPDRERKRLYDFISGMRVVTTYPAVGGAAVQVVVKGLSLKGANDSTFSMRNGDSITVSDYFRSYRNTSLRHPDIICVKAGKDALIPLEVLEVKPGQLVRKQIPPDKVKDIVEFSTKRPAERLASIKNGLKVLDYEKSEYVPKFGMIVSKDPIEIQGRQLKAPMLKYGVGSKQPTITPNNGAWNMIDKYFFKPAKISRWIVVVYERVQRFNANAAQDMISALVESCSAAGIKGLDPNPIVKWENGQGRIGDQLRKAGSECKTKTGTPPDLIVVVLPDGGNDIYTAVKHFGDITLGVATQCLKSSKCFRAKRQYFANVSLKINVKLGGINNIPDPSAVTALTDPHNPTIVMGADVIHPAPGSTGRPSFTALVANVDSDTARYIATSRVQTSHREMINDLQDMCKFVLNMYMDYRKKAEKKADAAPKRIIFYRDGVSEGEFKHVLDSELPLVKEACKELGINPKITLIVVRKRHHIRLFPVRREDADKSGNCPAGTVVDRDIAHPTEFDFFLQSHGGLLGTSRPAYYSVLHDDNNFSADALQSLSFALCHVYARATRSVSIPAPVYYADIVCSRAKNHYDPQGSIEFSDTNSQLDTDQADESLKSFKHGFLPLHAIQSKRMYFMAC